MPVVEGQVFLQVALVFGLIGLLGLVLRWTFRRDTTEPRRRAEEPTQAAGARPEASPSSPPTAPAGPDATKAGPTEIGATKQPTKRRPKAKQGSPGEATPGHSEAGADPVTAESSLTADRPISAERSRTGSSMGREDYGLLAVAAELTTAEEATKVRRVLTAAGIRNTNATTGDGRHRVLVFGDELMRARRVAGGSQGAGGGTAGSAGS